MLAGQRDRLPCDTQRRNNDDAPAGLLGYFPRPFCLHERLAQAGIRENSRAALA